jgi:PRTRC genetic system ThiF family protein
MKHQIPLGYLKNSPSILIVGAGGNGTQFINGLARMHLSLKALGHPGFNVALQDDDIVTEANVGRQLFAPSDVGMFKSVVLVTRLNGYYGLNWRAITTRFPNISKDGEIIVGCVDNHAARRDIAKHIASGRYDYWLDLGNDNKTGQVIMGGGAVSEGARIGELPTIADLFRKEVFSERKESDAPSCSLAGALEKQDLYINQLVATWALQLLWQFFRTGCLEHHGYFINASTGQTNPLPIDKEAWKRFGYPRPKNPPLKKIVKTLIKPGYFRPGKFKLSCGHIQFGSGKKRIRCKKCANK